MDGDPAVEPELDAFSLVLPLPYRVSLIIVLGIWAWGLNLHYLSFLKIDVPNLIRYPHRHSSTLPSHHLSVYRLATLLTIPLFLSILLFWTLTYGNPRLVLTHELLPQSYLILLILIFALPIQYLSRSGRYRFLSTLRRVSIGGIAEAPDLKFGDILLADVLTSYAKVLGDLFVSLCMFFSSGVSSTAKPNRGCGGSYVVPLIISIPSVIRLRQCLIEYLRVRRLNAKNGGVIGPAGWGGQHLANALKYSSAFPVIILSALQRGYDPAKIGLSETTLFRLWLLAVFLNSFYSFYWDVTKDWDLSLLTQLFTSPPSTTSSTTKPPSHPYGLRPALHLQTSTIYYLAILLDFLLRCTWSFKLSPHLDHFNDLEGGIFVMELLEVGRRWMWIFLRVETEWVRVNQSAMPLHNHHRAASSFSDEPRPDDILLSEYGHGNGKVDDD
ncbi:MAG: protein-ER retention protein [Caeruleum heppii]|nr:MAG: protein-ER retention protein [Caeruleum heppii]